MTCLSFLSKVGNFLSNGVSVSFQSMELFSDFLILSLSDLELTALYLCAEIS